MNVKPIITMKVAVVPSWLSKAISCGAISLTDLYSFNKLYTYAENGSLDKEEVYAYIMVNQRITRMFGDVFSDLHLLGTLTENKAFVEQHQAGLDAFDRVLKDEDVARMLVSTNDSDLTSIFKSNPGLLEKEYYVPKVVQAETLLLLGSTEPTFKNERAFYNATIEEVSRCLSWETLKSTNLMKHYLRNAVND